MTQTAQTIRTREREGTRLISLPEEIRSARDVQASLLPRRSPRLRSIEYAGLSLPARGVCGDYFDFVPAGPGRLAIAVGDISGKGVQAALVMASLQASIRSHYAIGVGDLAGRLRSVNRLLLECTAPQHYASLWLGEYDDATGRLRYANCGHNAPLLLRRVARIERLAPTATVLGMFEDWSCAVHEVRLVPGDSILLFTDGITDSASGRHFGESRLVDAFLRLRRRPVGPLVSEIARTTLAFSGGHVADDITLVVIRAVSTDHGRASRAETTARRRPRQCVACGRARSSLGKSPGGGR